MKNLNPVCWFDIHVSNLDRAKKFYEKVLDLKLTDLPAEWGKQSTFPFEEDSPNCTGALVEQKDFEANPSNTIVYFASSDCITEEERVKDAGGNIIKAKMPIGEFGFISLLSDPDGNTIGLYSRK